MYSKFEADAEKSSSGAALTLEKVWEEAAMMINASGGFFFHIILEEIHVENEIEMKMNKYFIEYNYYGSGPRQLRQLSLHGAR